MPAFPIAPHRRPQAKNAVEVSITPSGGCYEYAVAKWHSFAYECSVFGVRQSMDPERHWVVRIVWSIFVLSGIALATYQIESRIAYYVSYPTSTDVKVSLASSVQFPQVTICNENKFRKSVAQSLGIDKVLPEMFPVSTLIKVSTPDLSVLEKLNYTQEQWDELRVQLAQTVDGMIPFGLSFAGQFLPSSKMTPVATDMGICYAFGVAGSDYETIQPGASFGLTMIMNVNQSDYLVMNSGSAGFRMLIHDPQETPLMLQSAFFVTPGFTSSIAYTFENVTSLGPPYGLCNTDTNYRQLNCQLVCATNYIVQECNCKMSFMAGIQPRNCTILEDYTCANPALVRYMTNDTMLSNCKCPDECYTMLYQHTVSQAIFSNEFEALIVSQYGVSDTALIEDFAVFQLFLPTLKYTNVSMTNAYNVMALLSDIGGALALMLGATLLTFHEIGEFIHHLIREVILLHIQNNENKKLEMAQNGTGAGQNVDNLNLGDRWAAPSRANNEELPVTKESVQQELDDV